MRMLGRLLPILLLSATLSLAFGQAGASPSPEASPLPPVSNERLLEMLKEKALVFQVRASISEAQTVTWSAEQTRVTVHGLSVSVRLERPDLLIQIEMTPYRSETEILTLVVKSEIWIRSNQDKSVQYFASLKSAQVKLREPVYFYPLGKAGVVGKPGIRMDITINPYQEAKD